VQPPILFGIIVVTMQACQLINLFEHAVISLAQLASAHKITPTIQKWEKFSFEHIFIGI